MHSRFLEGNKDTMIGITIFFLCCLFLVSMILFGGSKRDDGEDFKY
jgi:hypothetical protein